MPLEVRRIKPNGSALLAVVAAIFMLSGCALQAPKQGPRYVEQITSSQKTIKLLYRQQVGAETKRGLIECDRAEDGSLNNCQNVDIHFQD